MMLAPGELAHLQPLRRHLAAEAVADFAFRLGMNHEIHS
jgi:hypothetical protein